MSVYVYTVNFQNNAQVQINAWFKLTPGYQAHCLQFMTLFLYFKRTPGPGHILEKYGMCMCIKSGNVLNGCHDNNKS